MLRPTKHSHPDKTVIYASYLILNRLIKNQTDSFDNLNNYVKQTIDGGEALFIPSISFLYLLGVVEYRQKTDSFEYKKKI
ncbi:ABC-three component system middle component 8 [Sutterella sp.]|uniref:ABC-three component system middle component 8 n=1 Tax=Sutterella sp. TaxID=1981025 RepID=UPI0026DF7D9E|nr:ABC-three component system middle component 8 [Sutterella sp.]MDO5530928.1 hypothetical protein [Sutterella sp.]